MDYDGDFQEEEEGTQPNLQGRNRKIDKKRLGYGIVDPLNRLVGKIDGMDMDEAIAWMSIIDRCNPQLKADIYSCWSDVKVDVGLVQNSCYVACLPCMFDTYTGFIRFLHEQAESEGLGKISTESVSEQWIRERLDLFMWH